MAVLQYHLYDLDVVVKKTLVAGTFAVLAVLAYGVVVGLYALIGTEGASSGSVFVVALLLGLAFRPVTRFVRRFADRVVYGRRATPYEVLSEFSERIGETYAAEDVLPADGAGGRRRASGRRRRGCGSSAWAGSRSRRPGRRRATGRSPCR